MIQLVIVRKGEYLGTERRVLVIYKAVLQRLKHDPKTIIEGNVFRDVLRLKTEIIRGRGGLFPEIKEAIDWFKEKHREQNKNHL